MNMQPKASKDAKKPNNQKRAWIRRGILLVLIAAAGGLLLLSGGMKNPIDQMEVSPTPALENTPQPTAGIADERSVREIAYDKDIASLQELMESESADEATRAQAAEQMERMIGDHQSELGVEEALRMAGFETCAVLLQNGSLTVIVSEDDMTSEKSAAILSLCAAHTDIGVENIRIMARDGA